MNNGAINKYAKNVEAAVPAARWLDAGDTPAATLRTIEHIYVHIPFCARICPYCAFYKERADASQTQRFCEAILREIDHAHARFHLQPQTIFFGGGTPTALTSTQLEFLLRGFDERIDLSKLQEWTVEANPGSVSARKAKLLRNGGVNRISLGVQSWDDRLLKILGREHNAEQAAESFHILREAGFDNLNIDLMFGLPGQSLGDWQATIDRTIALHPEHISTYCLTYEEDTEFFLRHSRGELRSDSDADAKFFETAMQVLGDAGYEHYEISNHARPGYSSVHNRAYWAGENYLGIGPSAFSTIEMKRWQNVADYRSYSDRVLAGDSVVTSMEELNDEVKRGEIIALSLRTQNGVPASWLKTRPNKRDEFLALGLLRQHDSNFVLTQKGKLLADTVAEAFV